MAPPLLVDFLRLHSSGIRSVDSKVAELDSPTLSSDLLTRFDLGHNQGGLAVHLMMDLRKRLVLSFVLDS